MKTRRWICLLGCVALCVSLGACSIQTVTTPLENDTQAQRQPVLKAETPAIGDLGLQDDPSLYSEYDPLEVECFYVTVRKGSAADGTNHSLQEVNSYLNLQGMTNVQKIYADAIIQVGDELGPLPGALGYDATEPNGTINVRGRTSTGSPQKSYRLSLNDNAGLWRGQRAIALNKHPSDVTRLRNMLYFRLLQDVPGMVSLRTQFVRLYVKDETADPADTAFVDYGLFTQVELPNNRFLRNHGLSRDSSLYKANMCEMYRYEDVLKLATDPDYDLAAFSEVLEPKVNENHEKLLSMLDAVNDYDRSIEEVIDKHFDLDNLTSYLAFNMITGNVDSDAQNYYLYSPVNSDKWYYLCWDGDGAFSYGEDELRQSAWAEGEWTKGISDYWSVVLFNRMLRVEEYRQLVADKMEQLRQIVTPSRIAALVADYRTVVDSYTTRLPDAVNMRVERSLLEQIYESLPQEPEIAYGYFLESLEKPMPYYLGDVYFRDSALHLEWENAYDFDGDLVYYDVQVATDWSFAPNTLIYESQRQLTTDAALPLPAAGTYYWRVIATNESGYSQTAFDGVETSTGSHSGMRRFSITEKGTVNNTP